MLELNNIKKQYLTGENAVHALKGISVAFRENEFVSILGPSGCGKTTLLNIIGGLDSYSSGDLIINGKSTKSFKSKDWDSYRNHSIGFVFQSYNLIPHQSVLSNVELALTLSGVSKAERRKRAINALNKVGIGNQLYKKPNQMSGGQMQRVAIARALVNNPDILLADEPTGALDSETSLQIMELLKEISKDKLVIMVTHNPELASGYSTRTIKLLDGEITTDSNPYIPNEKDLENKTKIKHHSMSFFTALSLSFNNLLTKKARTFLTSFAGSIGIIGIALILSLSSGVDAYINKVEEDTLTSYPIRIEESGMDISKFITDLMGNNNQKTKKEKNRIYSNNIMTDMMSTMINGMSENNLASFKSYIEKNKDKIKPYASDIKYGYSTQMNIYKDNGYRVNPNTVFESMGYDMTASKTNSITGTMPSSSYSNSEVWNELIDNDELLNKQYDILAGKMPTKYNEIVIVVDKNSEISDYTLYALGIKDSAELTEMIKKAMAGEKIENSKITSYSYDDLLSLNFKLVVNSDLFEQNENNTWTDKSEDELFLLNAINNKAIDVNVVGVLKPSKETKTNSSGGFVGYKHDLMTTLVEKVNDSEIVKYQKENDKIDIFTGLPFATNEEKSMDDLKAYISTLPTDQQAQYNGYIAQMQASGMSDSQIVEKFLSNVESSSKSTLADNLKLMGAADIDNPSSISIYPKDFESKDKISEFIDKYNKKQNDANKITYTDYIGLMLSSVTTIINAISYILIAFVSISLLVSSIMIGIITYISVLERTKEIGILRAMGASKRDVSRVFNAETLIVGFAAGAIGIGATLLLLIPINAIIKHFTDIANIAYLPTNAAVILVVISMLLTFVAGLIPSRIAAKKDPVTALRTE